MKPIHTLVCVAVLTCLQLFAIAQGTKTGSPEDRLPPNITQLAASTLEIAASPWTHPVSARASSRCPARLARS